MTLRSALFASAFSVAGVVLAGDLLPAEAPCPVCRVTVKRGVAPATTTPATTNATALHAGMVWIPGGTFRMGTDDRQFPDASPRRRVWVDGFWMNRTTVTNAEFAEFVRQTHYVTAAERPLDPAAFPGVPAELRTASSVVFSQPRTPVALNDPGQWWQVVAGADWRHPDGPASGIAGREQHPVVQVTYADADAYAHWAGKRLPSEAQFEYAARGGLDGKTYVWGDAFKPDGRFRANTFQGHFPDQNTADDGFAGTAPVGSFPANDFGLYDMSGNVWQWCNDWYRPDTYATEARGDAIAVNPTGPADSLDPEEPGIRKRAQRGGSFLCTDQYCTRYMVGSRGKGDVDTGTNHIGFRCVAPAK